jgi:hypothetical protein
VKAAVSHTSTPEGWAAILRQTDFRLGDGEAAVVVVDLRPEGIYGASVGDCQAWVLNDGAIINLTASQRRKPLLGTGKAQPMGLSGGSLQGVLIVATDGFCNYVKPASIGPLVTPAESALTAEFQSLPRALLSLVRLKSGELWDDVGLVVCRKQRARRTRKRYEVLD